MNRDRASKIADEVLRVARSHFEDLPTDVCSEIEVERRFLASELSDGVEAEFANWVCGYRERLWAMPGLSGLEKIEIRRNDPLVKPYLLFSLYYANLFFGVRQAAEIDSLRFAVESLDDPVEREWAMGALICAVSSCAYTYGGHFAQPRIPSERDRLVESAEDILAKRSLSVSQEFYVRLSNLGAESESVDHRVETVPGAWERALSAVESSVQGCPVCVYLDPPYTRDEYSRYYHVLETLVLYDYPVVGGKARIRARGTVGRFASPLSTRVLARVEKELSSIMRACLVRGWSCFWNYSSSGAASIVDVLGMIEPYASNVEVFSMQHSYKAQGRRTAKSVDEYGILVSPRV